MKVKDSHFGGFLKLVTKAVKFVSKSKSPFTKLSIIITKKTT